MALESSSAIEKIVLTVQTCGNFQASEILADLRNVSELLFFPLRSVGYWDGPSADHLCPQSTRKENCPHILSEKDASYYSYLKTVEDELHGILEVRFPHADVSIFLA